MDPLIRALIEQQETEGLGNNAFARKLGIDKATWSTIRRGISPSRRSGAIYEAALRVYPGIVSLVARELEIANSIDGDVQQSASVPMKASA